MSLLALKQYLSMRPMATKEVLQQVLGCDRELIDSLLAYWMDKGKIITHGKRTPQTKPICLGCQQGCMQEQIFYTWE